MLDAPQSDNRSIVGQAIIDYFETRKEATVEAFILSDLLAKAALGMTDSTPLGVFSMMMAAFVAATGAGISPDEFSDILGELTTRNLINLLPEGVMDAAREFNRSAVHAMADHMEDMLANMSSDA